MAEVIVRKWQCDRCWDLMEEKPNPGKKPVLQAFRNGDWHMEVDIKWDDLCDECTLVVNNLLDSISAGATKAREGKQRAKKSED